MNDWQNWVVTGIVLAAAGYVLRETWLICIAKKKKAGGHCGTCTGCEPAAPQIVTLGINLENPGS